jgi:ribosome maturation factor RimP
MPDRKAMQYTLREKDTQDPDGQLFFSLEPIVRGMGMSLIELNVFRIKGRKGKAGGVQIRAVVYRDGFTAVEDCTKVHRSITPRLELAFPGHDIYLEVSSPGINRLIKDGSEFVYYIGKGVNCYRTDISDWTAGILLAVDDKKIELMGEGGEISLPYEIIAKARLNSAVLPEKPLNGM